jgi:transcriptional regulator with XRE-family HTH domain
VPRPEGMRTVGHREYLHPSCIEEGGTEPTVALLRHLAAALDADVRLTSGHDVGSVWFETHAA